MANIRHIYILSITAAIIAAFTSFFSNEVKMAFFLFAIVMDTLVNKNAFSSKPLKLLLVFFVISFFYVFVLGRGHFSEIRNILLAYPMMLMCFWIAPGLTKLNSKEVSFIWGAFFLCLVETLIATTFIGQVDPLAVRYSFSNAEAGNEALAHAYSRMGMLSYQSSHLLSVLCSFLVVLAFKVKPLWKKLIVLFIALLAVYVMYLMTITTALLLGLLCMVAVAVFLFSKGNIRAFVVWFTVLTVLLLVTGGLTNILFSSSRGENYEIAEKLNDLAFSIESGSSQGQVAGREIEYNKTWDAIIRNPIFGGANGPEDTGQHALLFDYWAYYGIFSLVLFVAWWKEVKRMKSILGRKKWILYLICVLPIFLLCFFKGPAFLPYYILVTIVILRLGFLSLGSKPSTICVKHR